jgi:hypothetical protein
MNMGLFTRKQKRKVTMDEFQQMLAYRSFVSNEEEKQKVKMQLIQAVRHSYEDTWYRLKDGTKKVIDMLCWFAAEKGFVFAGDEYLADHYGVAVSTVRNVIKHMEKLGLIHKVYRTSTKHNGLGNRVLLFVNHEYFSYWNELLSLDYQAGCKAENAEIPTETRDGETKRVSTKDLSYSKQENNNYIDSQKVVQFVMNRIQDSMKKGKTIHYLSSYVNRIVTSLEQQAIYDENLRQIKAKKKEHASLYQEVKGLLGIHKPEPVPFYNWLEGNK